MTGISNLFTYYLPRYLDLFLEVKINPSHHHLLADLISVIMVEVSTTS